MKRLIILACLATVLVASCGNKISYKVQHCKYDIVSTIPLSKTIDIQDTNPGYSRRHHFLELR